MQRMQLNLFIYCPRASASRSAINLKYRFDNDWLFECKVYYLLYSVFVLID